MPFQQPVLHKKHLERFVNLDDFSRVSASSSLTLSWFT